ncbi:MAG: U32 family peptidase [Bacteroidales bacterium]|nr:U32 family peptidase [Candidatus Cryptobacteroides aphodequi]
MTALELLAPARNADIGIAAIDCGADAVYMAGPEFGARKDAGNPIEEIKRLCDYAHKFGARIFVTFNILAREDELGLLHKRMLEAQQAGADAFIVREPDKCRQWSDIRVPLHASTQCAIRTPERARQLRDSGCSRVVLERQLSLEQIRSICASLEDCEVECFVHGALCTGYSGQCRLSEYLTGRSADRGECAQACRSLYDLIDSQGRVLVRNKALLSLKDLSLLDRLEDLADAGVCSFKIEGRLKNISYVRNVTRAYSTALDKLCAMSGGKYCRASFGSVSEGFEADTTKTFNRGYTSLFLDGERGKWSSMDAPKSMGSRIGTVESLRPCGNGLTEVSLRCDGNPDLRSGDGLAFVGHDGIVGFRIEIGRGGKNFLCRAPEELRAGTELFRNLSVAFEKSMDSNACRRSISVDVCVRVMDGYLSAEAVSEDGRSASLSQDISALERASDTARMEGMMREGLGKKSGHYNFSLKSLEAEDGLPLLKASAINGIRRSLAEELDAVPCATRPLLTMTAAPSANAGTGLCEDSSILMRSKYCIRHELGMCLKEEGCDNRNGGTNLKLKNIKRCLTLQFDCRNCEMILTPEQK